MYTCGICAHHSRTLSCLVYKRHDVKGQIFSWSKWQRWSREITSYRYHLYIMHCEPADINQNLTRSTCAYANCERHSFINPSIVFRGRCQSIMIQLPRKVDYCWQLLLSSQMCNIWCLAPRTTCGPSPAAVECVFPSIVLQLGELDGQRWQHNNLPLNSVDPIHEVSIRVFWSPAKYSYLVSCFFRWEANMYTIRSIYENTCNYTWKLSTDCECHCAPQFVVRSAHLDLPPPPEHIQQQPHRHRPPTERRDSEMLAKHRHNPH